MKIIIKKNNWRLRTFFVSVVNFFIEINDSIKI